MNTRMQMTGDFLPSRLQSVLADSGRDEAKCCRELGMKQFSCQLCNTATENAELHQRLRKSNTENEKLQKEIELLKNELLMSRKKTEISEEEKLELKRSLHREMNESKKALEQKDAELRELEQLHKAQMSATHLADGKLLSDLKAKLLTAEEQVELLRSEHQKQLSAMEEAFELLKSSHLTLNKAYQSIKEENIELKAKAQTLSERIVSLLQNAELLSKLKLNAVKLESESAYSEVLESLEMLVNERSQINDDLERKVGDLEASLVTVRDQLKRSEAERRVSDEDLIRVRGRASILQKQVLELETAYHKAQETIEDLQSGKTRLRGELEGLEERLETENETRRETDARVSSLLRNVKKTEEVLVRTKEHLSKQDDQIDDITVQRNFLETSVVDLEAEIQRLEERLLRKSNRIETIHAELRELRLENENLKKQAIDVRKINDRLQDKLRASQTSVPEAESFRKLWQEEIQSRSALGLRVAHIDQEKQQLQRRLSKEKRRHNAQQHTKELTEAEMKQEKHRNVQLRKRVNQLKSRLAMLQNKRPTTLNSMPGLRKEIVGNSEKPTSKSVKSELNAETEQHFERQLTDTTDSSGQRNVGNRNETWRPETEKLAFDELNKKLNDMNARIIEQSQLHQKTEQQRDANEAAARANFRHVKQALKRQLSQLHDKNLELEMEKDAAVSEAERLRQMYEELRTTYVRTEAINQLAKSKGRTLPAPHNKGA